MGLVRRIAGLASLGLLVCAPLAGAAADSSRVVQAVIHASDVPHGKLVGTVGPYRTPQAFLTAWGPDKTMQTHFLAAYRAAGYRAGAMGWYRLSKDAEWASDAVSVRSPADATHLVDAIHDLYVGWGSRVTSDASTPHAFRVDTVRGHRLVDRLVYAMQGGLVVSVDDYDAHGVSPVAVARMLKRMLLRSAPGAAA
jgi:hypothetical protein